MVETQELYFAPEPLQQWAAGVLERKGMEPADALVVADVLVHSNLRGVDSHGVLRLPIYVGMIERGQINPRPKVEVVRETPATLLLECDLSIGHPRSVWAMERAIEKARQVGVGWAQLRNTAHQGALYYYSLMAARNDMVGMVLTATGPNVAPFGGSARGIGNSPFSFGAPAGKYPPLCLDVATSIVAYGKVRSAASRGEPIPEGWALDKDGNATVDPEAVVEGVLLPMGMHKGSGMAIMIEAIAGLVGGSPIIAPSLAGGEALPTEMRTPRGVGSVLLAMDIGAFADLAEYKAQTDEFIEQVKATRKAPGVEEILMPGEPEAITERRRTSEGIPLHPNLVRQLQELGQRVELAFPG
ncbi:MAG: Malate/lactate/ureidoglycolate dehydrogenase, LDH2 family [Chloroflexi bacterium]|nr:MAG: Malate/lactate/ureidoglycolate dehydrogenase, LDH2 family [Chloroflexota bacterium]